MALHTATSVFSIAFNTACSRAPPYGPPRLPQIAGLATAVFGIPGERRGTTAKLGERRASRCSSPGPIFFTRKRYSGVPTLRPSDVRCLGRATQGKSAMSQKKGQDRFASCPPNPVSTREYNVCTTCTRLTGHDSSGWKGHLRYVVTELP